MWVKIGPNYNIPNPKSEAGKQSSSSHNLKYALFTQPPRETVRKFRIAPILAHP